MRVVLRSPGCSRGEGGIGQHQWLVKDGFEVGWGEREVKFIAGKAGEESSKEVTILVDPHLIPSKTPGRRMPLTFVSSLIFLKTSAICAALSFLESPSPAGKRQLANFDSNSRSNSLYACQAPLPTCGWY